MQKSVLARLYTIWGEAVKMESIEKMTLGQILKNVPLRTYYREVDCGYSKGFIPIIYKGLEFRYKIGVAYIENHVAVVELPVTYKSGRKDYVTFDVALNGIYQFSKTVVSDINEDWTLEKCFDAMIMYMRTKL